MRHRNVDVVSDKDLEGQLDGGQEITWRQLYLRSEERIFRTWNKIFVASCVIAVSVDPLFFYIPVINEDKKCIRFDRKSQIIALCLRSVTDLVYILNIILRLYSFYIHKSSLKHGRTKLAATDDPEMRFYSLTKQVIYQKRLKIKFVTNAFEIASSYWRGKFLVDILSILPIPQVVIVIMFLKMEGPNYLQTRPWLNVVVFLQYVPRVLRIYLSWTELIETGSTTAKLPSVRAAFNLFLYIIGSHVLGAFWYFLSIERETACWLTACKNNIECDRKSLNCKKYSGNFTFLIDLCPVKTPNTTLFDFGIYLQTLQSGVLESTYIPKKLLYCFWWGLQNVSSFGSSLQTSTDILENVFAVFISIYGLLLFIYFVGNLQVYMTSKATKSLTPEASKIDEEKKEEMKNKRLQIGEWVFRNKLPCDIRGEILSKAKHIFEKNKGVDVENLLPLLSPKHREGITEHLCLPMLNKVELEALKKWREFYSCRLICKYLKPAYYNENNDIVREGEPLDKMVLITSGTVLMTDTGSKKLNYFGKGQFFGEELLDWGLKSFDVSSSPNLSNLTIYTKTVKTHTKVEAFILTANNLKDLVDNITRAPVVLQRAWRRKHDQCNHSQHCHHYHHDQCNHCQHCHHYSHQPDQPQSVPGANSASPSGNAQASMFPITVLYGIYNAWLHRRQ